MSTDRSEYRDHAIEITSVEEAAGCWLGDWAVFEKEPFRAVGAGMLPVPAESHAAARVAAWRHATVWVDAYRSASAAVSRPHEDELMSDTRVFS